MNKIHRCAIGSFSPIATSCTESNRRKCQIATLRVKELVGAFRILAIFTRNKVWVKS